MGATASSSTGGFMFNSQTSSGPLPGGGFQFGSVPTTTTPAAPAVNFSFKNDAPKFSFEASANKGMCTFLYMWFRCVVFTTKQICGVAHAIIIKQISVTKHFLSLDIINMAVMSSCFVILSDLMPLLFAPLGQLSHVKFSDRWYFRSRTVQYNPKLQLRCRNSAVRILVSVWSKTSMLSHSQFFFFPLTVQL